jgi:hypothetical protein
MTRPVLHKYFDFGDSALANLTLASGERVLLSIVPSGTFEVRRFHLGGFVPGRRLFKAQPLEAARLAQVIARERDRLPPLPTATGEHRDASAARDRPLSLFTRLALAAADADDFARRCERARNTPD